MDVSGCQSWWRDIWKRLCSAWLNDGSLTKSQRLSSSASSFRSPEICDRSNSMPEIVHSNVNLSKKWFRGDLVENSLLPPASVPVLSVKEGIRNGNLKPGELRLKIYRIAIWARVSKDAIHFCISLVTGMSSAAKSLKVNFSLSQITVLNGK